MASRSASVDLQIGGGFRPPAFLRYGTGGFTQRSVTFVRIREDMNYSASVVDFHTLRKPKASTPKKRIRKISTLPSVMEVPQLLAIQLDSSRIFSR